MELEFIGWQDVLSLWSDRRRGVQWPQVFIVCTALSGKAV